MRENSICSSTVGLDDLPMLAGVPTSMLKRVERSALFHQHWPATQSPQPLVDSISALVSAPVTPFTSSVVSRAQTSTVPPASGATVASVAAVSAGSAVASGSEVASGPEVPTVPAVAAAPPPQAPDQDTDRQRDQELRPPHPTSRPCAGDA